MDNKRLLIGIAVGMIAIPLYILIINTLDPNYGKPRQDVVQPAPDTSALTPTTQGSTLTTPGATTQSATATGPTSAPSVVAAPLGIHGVSAATPQAVAMLGSAVPVKDQPQDGPQYAIQMMVSPIGAGLEAVTLNPFLASNKSDDPYVFEHVIEAEKFRPLATTGVTIDGVSVDLSSLVWTSTGVQPAAEGAGTQVTLQADVADADGKPLVKLSKRFVVYSTGASGKEGQDGPEGFEAQLELGFRNLTDRELVVQSTLNGPTLPPVELASGIDRVVLTAYRGEDNRLALDQHHVGGIKEETAVERDDDRPLAWLGTGNTYFASILRFEDAEESFWGAKVSPLGKSENRATQQVAVQFTTAPATLPAGGAHDASLRIFFGPKQRELLKNGYYASPGLRYDLSLLQSTMCSFCVFTPVIDALVALLSFMHFVFRDWGMAIIGLVVVVRVCLHPITKRSQLSMLKMGKLGPEVEKLKKKYGDDKVELNKHMMELYRTQGVAPVLGCLPMLLQTPIWIALWQALNSEFHLRLAEPFYGLTWIEDLSRPDGLIELGTPIPLIFGFELSGINILPLLLAVVFYLQMKMQPMPATMSPEQEQQQKIMKFMMPVMFPLFLYSSPSGLCLYIITSTTIGIVESKIVRKHAAEIEAREEQARLEGKPTKVTAARKGGAATGGIGGFFAKLQQRVEQAQAMAEQNKKDTSKKNKRK